LQAEGRLSVIKAIVVDDEFYTLQEIGELLEKSGCISVVKMFENPAAALKEAGTLLPQVAFLDIEMPEMDGLTLAERLLCVKPDMRIVFITAYNQYAVAAFDLNAVDYILKPIDIDRFYKMTDKIIRAISSGQPPDKPMVDIACFGQFKVHKNGIPVKWERSKAEELFAYLLVCHGSKIHKSIILEDLWPEYEPAKAIPILHTSIYKIRSLFSDVREMIDLKYAENCYCLTLTGVKCDYFTFEKDLEGLLTDRELSYEKVEGICEMYGKGFLGWHDYCWSLQKDQDIRERLVGLLRHSIEKYDSAGDLYRLTGALRLLARTVPYDEAVNNRLLYALGRQARREEIVSHFMWLEKTLKASYDSAPADSTRHLYRSLIR
jgi:two-component system, LytTR family, response regulator